VAILELIGRILADPPENEANFATKLHLGSASREGAFPIKLVRCRELLPQNSPSGRPDEIIVLNLYILKAQSQLIDGLRPIACQNSLARILKLSNLLP
jgi:hypothetical protein